MMTGLCEQKDHFGVDDLDKAFLAEGRPFSNPTGRCTVSRYRTFMGFERRSIYTEVVQLPLPWKVSAVSVTCGTSRRSCPERRSGIWPE